MITIKGQYGKRRHEGHSGCMGVWIEELGMWVPYEPTNLEQARLLRRQNAKLKRRNRRK